MDRYVIMGNWWPWKTMIEMKVTVVEDEKTRGVDAWWKKWV